MVLRVLIGGVGFYLLALLALFVMQGRFIYPASQELHPPAPGFEAVSITTADGLEHIVHWRAPEADKPTLVYFHGNGGTLAGSTKRTELLASMGYGVLLASYRGYGGNSGEPSEEGLYADGRAALAFLADQGVEPGRTIIAGNSIGSGTAVQMASELGPAGLILIAPFTSLPDVAADALPIVPARLLMRDRFDNLAKLPELSLPILIMHGRPDRVVPFAFGEELANSNPRVRFIAFDNAGHELALSLEAQIAQAEWLEAQGLY